MRLLSAAGIFGNRIYILGQLFERFAQGTLADTTRDRRRQGCREDGIRKWHVIALPVASRPEQYDDDVVGAVQTSTRHVRPARGGEGDTFNTRSIR